VGSGFSTTQRVAKLEKQVSHLIKAMESFKNLYDFLNKQLIKMKEDKKNGK